MNVWGIHMGEHVGSLPVETGYVGIGWDKLGDLSTVSQTREKLKKALRSSYPNKKQGAIPVDAGTLYKFVNDLQQGDIVIYPSKTDRMVNVGRVISDYKYEANDKFGYPNHRKVEWLGHFPRSDFKQSALNEIGSFLTLFSVRRHIDDFLIKVSLSGKVEKQKIDESEDEDDDTVTESVALRAAEATEDFIINRLYKNLNGYEFEHFVAHILECIGYTTRVSARSADGGVDVIAHNDELGFEPPIIKVQCKKSTGQNSEPEVSQLLGTLGEGEYALFVNLGSYSKPARVLERNKAKLRLIDGDEFAALVMEHYQKLTPKYRALLPLKQIYVPDLSKTF